MNKQNRIKPFFIAFITICIGIFAYMAEIPFLNRIELDTIDLRFKCRGELKPNSNIVLAVIDEKSIAKEGKWIWPRSKIANLITKLSQAGVKVIAFDIGFLEPDENDKYLKDIITNIKKHILETGPKGYEIDNYLEKLKTEVNQDMILARSIKESHSDIVLGYFFHTAPDKFDKFKGAEPVKESIISTHQKNIAGSEYKIISTAPDFQNSNILDASVPQSNITIISAATEYSGNFNMEPDSDGVVRHIPLVIKFKKRLYAPLSLITASAYLKKPLSIELDQGGVKSIKVGNRYIPTDNSGNMFINYYGTEGTFQHISVTDILNADLKKLKYLKGKIVMVGATAIGIYDMRVTPFESIFPGLEIHANTLENILSENYIQHPDWIPLIDMFIIFISGILLGIILPGFQIIGATITIFIMFLSHIFLGYYLFAIHGVILNIVYPVFVMLLIYMEISVYSYFMESRQKAFIKDAFSRYLAPSVVKKLIDSPESLVLGGEERYITAFFSDVQGFTSISEKLSPTEIAGLLNEFLTEMTDIILKYEGTVDKYEGDAIIAFFGAPNYIENQAEVACRVCIEMQKKLVELRKKWKAEQRPQMKMRIGMCTGFAVVGNMGSKSRMDYTMIGDTVNTAARLEGANKLYGSYTIISETTAMEAGTNIILRELDLILTVGKKKPIKIYEIIGLRNDIDEKTSHALTYFNTGLELYRKQNWIQAIEFFDKTLELIPDDEPSKAMKKRCNEYKENPPDKNWGGVYTSKVK